VHADEKLTAAGGKNDTGNCMKISWESLMRLHTQTPDTALAYRRAGKTYTALQFLRSMQVRARALGLKTSCALRLWHCRSRRAGRGTAIAEQHQYRRRRLHFLESKLPLRLRI
jgi:hypothetical protein